MIKMDLVMLSEFGVADGGRETWAYNFIPLLLNELSDINISIFGLSQQGKADNTDTLLMSVPKQHRNRLQITFLRYRKKILPLFFHMFWLLRKKTKTLTDTPPSFVIGVGGVFELLMLLFTKRYRKTTKIMWFRSIFFQEKASKFPKLILPILKRLEFKLLKKIDILIANGEDICEYYEKAGLTVHHIPNGVDLKKWQLTPPRLTTPIKIAFIGRLADVKGINVFISAVNLIKSSDEAKRFEFHVVGSGPFQTEVQACADKGTLKYHGALQNKELPIFLDNMDACVALTKSSNQGGGAGTSNALMEQMAAGRIIIAWDNIIFRQVLNEVSAYLVPQDDLKSLCSALRKILDDRETAISKAQISLESIKEFGLEKQTKKFIPLLNLGITH